MKKRKTGISILSDYGFKVTFADENDTLFLRKSLQAVIQLEYEIKKVKFLRHEFSGITPDSRGGLYDLLCEDERGTSFIVEMQLGVDKGFIQRSKFYAFQRFNTLIMKGNFRFDQLTKIYCVGFLAFSAFPESELYYHIGTLKNQIGEEIDAQITHIILEIPKFEKDQFEIQSNLDKLLYFMKNYDHLTRHNEELPDFMAEDWLEKALAKFDISKMTPEEYMFFQMALAKRGTLVRMEEERLKEEEEKRKREEEKQKREKVKWKEEMEKRKEKMEEEMMKIEAEMKQQMKERQKKKEEELKKQMKVEISLATARKLKAKSIDIETIQEITGLSIEEIAQL